MLRIAYVNSNGLSINKFRTLKHRLLSQLDIIFVAETWDVDWRNWSMDETFVTAARGTGGSALRQRLDGGLAAFARPPIRPLITVTDTTPSTISIKIGDQKISAIYLRPSMGTETF